MRPTGGYPKGTMRVYCDHAATTPLSDAAWRAMEPFLREHFGNPSEPHAAGRAARAGLDAARESVAATLGASSRRGRLHRRRLGGRQPGRARPSARRAGASSRRDRAPGRARAAAGVDGGRGRPGRRSPRTAWSTWTRSALVRPGDALCCVIGRQQRHRRDPAGGRDRRAVRRARRAAARRRRAGRRGAAASARRAARARSTARDRRAQAGRAEGRRRARRAAASRRCRPVLHGGGQEHGLRPGTENVAPALPGSRPRCARRVSDSETAGARRASRPLRGQPPGRCPRRDRSRGRRAPAGTRLALLAGVRGDTLVHAARRRRHRGRRRLGLRERPRSSRAHVLAAMGMTAVARARRPARHASARCNEPADGDRLARSVADARELAAGARARLSARDAG